MPALTRHTKPLLKQVDGKPHATPESHEPEDAANPPVQQEEDLFREPESSDAETPLKPSMLAKQTKSTDQSNSKKRKAEQIERTVGEEPLFDMFATTERKPRKTYGKSSIVLPPKAKPKAKSSSEKTVFKSPPSSSPITVSAPKVEFRPPPSMEGIKPVARTLSLKQLPDTRSTRSTRTSARISTPESTSNDVAMDGPHFDIRKEMDSTCPTCARKVPEELLAEWRVLYPKMSIRIQQRFCQAHKLQSARDKWISDHPKHAKVIDINWKDMERRLQDLRGEMLWLIERPELSFYREQFERAIVNTGDSRTMLKHIIRRDEKQLPKKVAKSKARGKKQTHENEPNQKSFSISVGYYGTKGLRTMMEFITREFSDQLRAQITTDKLVAARDVSGYIHMVLAPELGSRLVMEDMNIGKEEARRVMAESSELGDLLHGSTDEEPI